MGNFIYDKAREKFLNGDRSWRDDAIKSVLVDVADYTANQATHEFLSDIPSGGRVAISPNMATKTTAAGVAGAANYSYGNVTGDPSEAIVYYYDSGSAATSDLICYCDTATGLPVTPNGGPINVQIPSTGNKLFKL